MDMNRWIFLLFSVLLVFSCNESASSDSAIKNKEDIKENEVASTIRIPVSAVDEVDPNFVPKMTFDEMIYDFGTIKEGKVVEHTFEFENTGEVPLLIGDARSTCGCTVPTFPKDYMKPGSKGEIKVIFDSKNLSGNISKPITIISNTYPRETKLFIKGIVEKHDH